MVFYELIFISIKVLGFLKSRKLDLFRLIYA